MNKKFSGHFVVRIKPETHEALADRADKNYLSLNALVSKILDTSVKKSNKKVTK